MKLWSSGRAASTPDDPASLQLLEVQILNRHAWRQLTGKRQQGKVLSVDLSGSDLPAALPCKVQNDVKKKPSETSTDITSRQQKSVRSQGSQAIQMFNNARFIIYE